MPLGIPLYYGPCYVSLPLLSHHVPMPRPSRDRTGSRWGALNTYRYTSLMTSPMPPLSLKNILFTRGSTCGVPMTHGTSVHVPSPHP